MEIKFISYDGRFPNLCTGVLKLEINGEIYNFAFDYKSKKREHPEEKWYPSFWRSGGAVYADPHWNFTIDHGPWDDDFLCCESQLPEELKNKLPEMLDIFNENVEYGCCGGCT